MEQRAKAAIGRRGAAAVEIKKSGLPYCTISFLKCGRGWISSSQGACSELPALIIDRNFSMGPDLLWSNDICLLLSCLKSPPTELSPCALTSCQRCLNPVTRQFCGSFLSDVPYSQNKGAVSLVKREIGQQKKAGWTNPAFNFKKFGCGGWI